MIQVTPEIEAIVLKARADKAAARAQLLRYTDDSKIASIGEHPNIQEIVLDAITRWGDAHDVLTNFQAFAQEEAQLEAQAAAIKAQQEKTEETKDDGDE